MVIENFDRARAKIQFWKSSFLDLSYRNDQLNFNPFASDVIELIHPDGASLFKILLIMQQTFSFPPIYTPPKRKSVSTNTTVDLTIKNVPPEITRKLPKKHLEILKKNEEGLRLTQLLTYENDVHLAKKIHKLMKKTQEMLEERGINILYLTLGLLNWMDPNDKKPLTSPIMFIPVKFQTNPFELEILDDEVIVNPALKEKLREFRIQLHSFPAEFNTQTFIRYMESVKDQISTQEGWMVEDRIFISNFSFTKVNLFEDIDDHEDLLLQHPVVKAIAEESGFIEEKENLPDLSQLSDEMDPKRHFTLLDCDSSQLEAILYAKSGCSLVIQGPPGTGKSQCITNIIGECLATGKKVLFVAQKKAALDVVKRRLEDCGVGNFCLQVHSQNANKKDILKAIDDSLSRTYNIPTIQDLKFQDLIHARNKLNEYVELINQPFGKMQKSLYQIVGKMLKFDKIPKIIANFKDPNEVTLEDYTYLKHIFGELDQFRSTLENFSQNPWFSAKITNKLILSNELKVILKKRLTSFRNCNSKLQNALTHFHLKYPPHFDENPELLTDWQQKIEKIKYWIDGTKNLFGYWNEMEEDYVDLLQYFEIDDIIDYNDLGFDSFRQIKLTYEEFVPENEQLDHFMLQKLRLYLEKLQNFHNHLSVFNLKSNLTPIYTLEDFQEVQDFFSKYLPKSLLLEVDMLVTRFTTDYLSWIKRLSGEYKSDKRSILECRIIAKKKANPMGHLNQIKSFQDKFGKQYHLSDSYFAKIYQDFKELYAEWESFQELENFLLPILNVSYLPYDFNQSIWDQNHIFTQQWLDNLPFLNDWFEVQVRAHHIADLGFESLFDDLIDQKFYFPDINTPISYELIFLHSFYSRWVENLTDSLPPIANFDRMYHEKYLTQFRKRDVEILEQNQVRLKKFLAQQRPQSDLDLSPDILRQIGYIRRESKKKRNIKPLRQVFSEARELITSTTPCLLMSPLSIANYLDITQFNQFFDVVIFDEASQVTPEDAVGAIVRGKSLVVVGDSEQLPPTRFFMSKKSDDILEDDLEAEIQTMESLLDECTGIGFREKMLKFHYRSRKEELIAFSNYHFYNGKLFSFPDVSNENLPQESLSQATSSLPENNGGTSNLEIEDYTQIVHLPAIQFRYIPKGIKTKGKNPIEAKAIAEAIINHYSANQVANTNYSLGVVAFSVVQQEEIQKALQKLLKSQPEIEEFMNTSQMEPLFIKNLENVQGDERDFIFFSVGYTKDATGNMSLNFGPLNRSGGYRRLNVAITRARYHIKLFASFLPTEINMDRVNARGLRELLKYMQYARTHQLTQTDGADKADEAIELENDSLEADIREHLEKEGFTIVPKVGVSNIRIDLAIVHPEDPNRYILGIECDGGSYRTAFNARDRDRIRYNVLTGLGWVIYHIWTPDWISNKKKIISHIKRTITSALNKERKSD